MRLQSIPESMPAPAPGPPPPPPPAPQLVPSFCIGAPIGNDEDLDVSVALAREALAKSGFHNPKERLLCEMIVECDVVRKALAIAMRENECLRALLPSHPPPALPEPERSEGHP